jgi:hypothetical protein
MPGGSSMRVTEVDVRNGAGEIVKQPFVRVSDLLAWAEASINGLDQEVNEGRLSEDESMAATTVIAMLSVTLALTLGKEVPSEVASPEFVEHCRNNLKMLTEQIEFVESLGGLDTDDLIELSKVSPETLGQDRPDN